MKIFIDLACSVGSDCSRGWLGLGFDHAVSAFLGSHGLSGFVLKVTVVVVSRRCRIVVGLERREEGKEKKLGEEIWKKKRSIRFNEERNLEYEEAKNLKETTQVVDFCLYDIFNRNCLCLMDLSTHSAWFVRHDSTLHGLIIILQKTLLRNFTLDPLIILQLFIIVGFLDGFIGALDLLDLGLEAGITHASSAGLQAPGFSHGLHVGLSE